MREEIWRPGAVDGGSSWRETGALTRQATEGGSAAGAAVVRLAARCGRQARWPQRLARFCGVGLACGALQLALLAGFVRLGAPHVLANLAALVLSTQVNFLLSAALIWPERSTLSQPPGVVFARLLGFNATAVATTLLNEAVFAAALRVVPYLVAGAAGIAVAAPINYLVQHGLIFQRHERKSAHEPRRLDLHRHAGL